MFNINNFIVLYRDKLRAVGVTGSTVRIQARSTHPGRLIVLTHVSAENLTALFTKIRLGISNRGDDFYLDELTNLSAAELCVSTSDIILGDGDRFFAEFTGTTTGDSLVLNLMGWEQRI